MLALLGLVCLAVVQQQTLSQSRAVNQEITKELERLRAENKEVQRLQIQAAESDQLRENTRDLMRLRNEVRQLRNQQEETELLRAANAQLLQLLQGMHLSSNQEAVVAAVRKKGAVLGIYARPANDPQAAALVTPRDSGVVVMGVDPNSPVAQSDLKVGDIIIRLDGRQIDTFGQLQIEMLTKQPGETVVLDVIRSNAAVRIPVKSRSWPQ